MIEMYNYLNYQTHYVECLDGYNDVMNSAKSYKYGSYFRTAYENIADDYKRMMDEDIAELYLISDVLITDYSSVFFDFANLKRPILFYTYDIEKYSNTLRGFYINIYEDVPGPLLYTTDEVIDAIENIESIKKKYAEKYNQFYDRFCSIDDGNASKRIVERIWK